MPIYDQNRIYDGFDNVIGGVDYGRKPHLIDRGIREQCQEAENVVFRGGAPKNRPAFLRLTLTHDNPNMAYGPEGNFSSEDSGVPQGQNFFEQGVFQGVSYYAPREGQEFLMATIAGRLYKITLSDTTARVLEIKLLKRNRNTILIAYHCQADVYFIVQDDESPPIIFDGVTARRAITGEIPVGTIMAYGMNRIVLVRVNGDIEFGNIRDGKGNGGADVLGWDENSFLNEGFPSAIPSSMGQPTAVAFIPQQDTATGVGECLVFGQRGVESFYLSIPREQWKDSQFQRSALLGIGNLGHRSVSVLNEDIWFRASDGWRSYRQARAQVNEWAQIPMSTNVRQFTENDTEEWLSYGSAIQFYNRLIGTCTPQPNVVDSLYAIQRLYHNGMLSLDFDILASFGEVAKPAWDGRWTSFDQTPQRVLQLVTGQFNGKERAFAFCIDDDNRNCIFEITKTGVKDTRGPIHSYLITRSMDFSSPFNEKTLFGGDLWFDEVSADDPVAVTTSYRPDQTPDFRPWHNFTVNNNGGVATPVAGIPATHEGYDPRRSLPMPDDSADPVTNRIWRLGYEFQARIEWVGHAAIRKFRIHDQQLTEESKAVIP